MLPVPIIFLFARKVLEWGADKPVIGKFFTFCLEKGALAKPIMIPARITPPSTAITLDLKSISRRLAARVGTAGFRAKSGGGSWLWNGYVDGADVRQRTP